MNQHLADEAMIDGSRPVGPETDLNQPALDPTSPGAIISSPEDEQKVDPLADIIPAQVSPIESQEQLLALQDTHLNWKESILNPKSRGSVGRACFKGLDLKHLNFSQLDFSYADFSDCDAVGVDFSAANLSRANFSKAQLNGANFSAAILKKTSFIRTALGNADFTAAVTETADFSWATGDYPDQMRHKKPAPEPEKVEGESIAAAKVEADPVKLVLDVGLRDDEIAPNPEQLN